MVFIHDTKQALAAAVYLVNTLPGYDGQDTLQTPADLDAYLAVNPYTGVMRRDEAEVEAVRGIRSRLRQLWDVDREGAVPIVNEMLRDGRALPRLVIHGDYDWHIHATSDDAPLARRIAVEVGMALVDVIRAEETDRLKVCAGEDCEDLIIDLSKNRSRKFCAGTCGTRANVAAYRARRATTP